jgi:predicted small secreted protein
MMKLGKTVSAALALGSLLAALSGCQKQEGPAEQAGKEVDNAAEQAGKDVDKAAEKVGEQIEEAGENIQDAAKNDNK